MVWPGLEPHIPAFNHDRMTGLLSTVEFAGRASVGEDQLIPEEGPGSPRPADSLPFTVWLQNEQRPGGPRPPALDVPRTSRELADHAHGDVGTGTRAPQPAAALNPVATVVAQHAGAQARGPPVGVVHSCVVLPDQGAPCGKGGIGGLCWGWRGAGSDKEKPMGKKRPVLEKHHLPQILTALPQVLTPHPSTLHHRPSPSGGPPPAS